MKLGRSFNFQESLSSELALSSSGSFSYDMAANFIQKWSYTVEATNSKTMFVGFLHYKDLPTILVSAVPFIEKEGKLMEKSNNETDFSYLAVVREFSEVDETVDGRYKCRADEHDPYCIGLGVIDV